MSYANLAEMFFKRAQELATRPRYRYRVADGWREVTWQTMAERVRAIAAGLIDSGVAPGDRVALLSNTRPEWMEIDFAILACGALTVPIYQSNLPAECGYIIANSESSVVFVENPKQRAKIEEVTRHGFELDGVRQTIGVRAVITIEGDPGAGESLAALVKRGRDALGHLLGELDARIADLRRDQLATIVYTSGTTGPPKGVLQTHGNHLATVESLLKLGMAREGDVDFFFLPLAHSFARLIEYFGIAAGTVTAFARSIDNLAEDLAASRPHLVPAVPRIYEKLYGRIQGARESGGALRRALFDWAVGVGRARSTCEQEGRPVPALVQWQHALAHRLVFSRIHRLLGGNIRYMTSGGAPLSREIAEFFHAVGIPILEGYGLTETTPSLTVNQPERFKLGTVGLPLDCCELRIAPDGEILARGPNIMKGYGGHRRELGPRGLVPHRRHRRVRRGRLPPHHRPQEGPDQDLGRQVRRAAEDREPAQAPAAREPGGGDRRQPQVLHGTHHARSGGGRALGERAGASLRGAGGDGGASQGARADRGRGGGGEQGARLLRVDQVLPHPAAGPVHRDGRTHPEPQGEA